MEMPGHGEMRVTYYQPSSRLAAVALALGLSVAMAVVLAFVYGYVVGKLSSVGYITAILAFGFGICMGLASTLSLRLGKVHSKGASWLVVILAGVIGYSAHWVVWTYVVLTRAGADLPLTDLLINPQIVWNFVLSSYKSGTWSIRGWTPTGGTLRALWFLEAVIIFAGTLKMGRRSVGVRPFCQGCNVWCVGPTQVAVLGTAGLGTEDIRTNEQRRSMLRERVERGDWAYLATLGYPDDENLFYRLELYICPQCEHTSTLTVQEVRADRIEADEGDRLVEGISGGLLSSRAETWTEAIVDKLLITARDVAALRQLQIAAPRDETR